MAVPASVTEIDVALAAVPLSTSPPPALLAFTLGGRDLIYFAAFKNHIGLYPPVRGDAKLLKRVARYQNEKGNLRITLDEPIPFALIAKIAKANIKRLASSASKRPTKQR